MPSPDDEEARLRSVALQNAQSIQQARRRAEEELVRAKEELERKTEALANTIAIIRATLESTADGILVTDRLGQVTDYNEKFRSLWGLSPDQLQLDHRQLSNVIARHFDDPTRFVERIEEIYAGSLAECSDLLELRDGRVFERVSRPQFIGARNVGRVWSVRDITVRRRAEEALRKQSEWLRVTLTSIGDGVITTDTASRVTSVNPVAERLTGWTQAEAHGILLGTIFRIVNETSRQLVENPAVTSMREGRIVGLANHTLLIARDGTERAIDDSAAPIRDESGALLGAVLIFRDVTQQRRAESARLRLAAIVDSSADAIVSKTLDGIIDSWNDGAQQIFGYTAEEAVGRSITMLLPKGHEQEEVEILRWMRRGENLAPIETIRVHKHGHLINVSVTTSPICDAAGNVVGASKIARDITTRKRNEVIAGFLADSSAALVNLGGDQAAIEAVSRLAVPTFADWCAVDLQDVDGPIRRVAEACRADTPDLAERLAAPSAVHPEDPLDILAVLRSGRARLLPQGTRAPSSDTLLPGDGRAAPVPVGVRSCISVPLRSRVRTVGVVTFATGTAGRLYDAVDLLAAEDLAHRMGIAIENAKLLGALKEADQRKDIFLATLAHELRNPLAPIRNAAEIIRVKSPTEPDLQWATDIIDRQVHQMSRLVDDLLDVSRINRGTIQLRTEAVDFPELMRTVLDASRPFIEKRGHTLVVTATPDPFRLIADQTRLCQILVNLLDNAAKYTDRGGRIWLTVELEASTLVIHVRDTGIGLAPETLTGIFEMFSQVDRSLERSEGGLGIGLMLVKQLVEMHGGTVRALSAGLGQGSEFVVRLPVAGV